jgi:murein DD-endopeptidase MepM/ murein hydrolase activator NlpD
MKREGKVSIVAFLILLLQASFSIKAQDLPNENILRYIETYAPLALKEMNRTGVPAAIKIAQGILETNAGQSDLVNKSNNHFGIKCKSSWTGEKVYHDDDEAGECFRKYESAEASYLDHSDYLKSQPRYAFLFEFDSNDYAAWAWGLKKAGYATNPIYAQSLIKYIETYRLTDLHDYLDEEEEDPDLSEYFASLRSPIALPPLTKANNGPREETSLDERDSEKKGGYISTIFKHNSKVKTKGSKTYTVKKGDSLYSIARKYKTTVEALKKSNKLKKDALQPGQKLKIKK